MPPLSVGAFGRLFPLGELQARSNEAGLSSIDIGVSSWLMEESKRVQGLRHRHAWYAEEPLKFHYTFGRPGRPSSERLWGKCYLLLCKLKGKVGLSWDYANLDELFVAGYNTYPVVLEWSWHGSHVTQNIWSS